MIIVGEVFENRAKICFLERISCDWIVQNKVCFIPAYTPIFFELPLSPFKEKTSFEFKSISEGIEHIRTCTISRNYDTSYVVACNNRHVFKECSIWNKIREHPVDVLLHCGDQIYADRIFWRWFYELDKATHFSSFKQDIELDYYREYLDTWEPLQDILSTTSSIMVPDDHEARSRADLWTDKIKKNVADKLGDRFKSYLIDEKKSEKQKSKEDFLFATAFALCKNLYLGLRITNKERFDFIQNYGKVTIVMTERITQPLFSEEFLKMCRAHKFAQNVLLISGLPPMPVRENFIEALFYRHPQVISNETYDNCLEFFEKLNLDNFVAVGGDIHLGSGGEIYSKAAQREIGRFHTTGPSSGFTSGYIVKDNLGSTDKYEFRVQDFNNRDPNAVFVDLEDMHSSSIYEPSTYRHGLYNLGSTGYSFWT